MTKQWELTRKVKWSPCIRLRMHSNLIKTDQWLGYRTCLHSQCLLYYINIKFLFECVLLISSYVRSILCFLPFWIVYVRCIWDYDGSTMKPVFTMFFLSYFFLSFFLLHSSRTQCHLYAWIFPWARFPFLIIVLLVLLGIYTLYLYYGTKHADEYKFPKLEA